MKKRTHTYSQRHLISVAEMASAIAHARRTSGVDELRMLAELASREISSVPLYPPHQLWQHGGDVNRIGLPTDNSDVIWRSLVAKSKPQMSDKDAFKYPTAASTWHMLAADVYEFASSPALAGRAGAALRELAVSFSPELSDPESQTAHQEAPKRDKEERRALAGARVTPDPERRLARLRALGGEVKYKRGQWAIIGITALVASEKSEGLERSSEKTIRADLKEAAENEREAKRAGPFDSLVLK